MLYSWFEENHQIESTFACVGNSWLKQIWLYYISDFIDFFIFPTIPQKSSQEDGNAIEKDFGEKVIVASDLELFYQFLKGKYSRYSFFHF